MTKPAKRPAARWSLVIVAAALVSCEGTVSTPAGPSRIAGQGGLSARSMPSGSAAPVAVRETPETRLVEKMLRRVEAARGLEATRAVPGVRLDRAALVARVKEHVTTELPPEAIQNEGLALQLFGFLPTKFDYEAAEYRLLQDQLAGYYEPADKTMYMASDLGEEEATATLAHELVHALQDQHWDLEARSKYRAGDGDRSEALSALAEGDATSAMFDVMIRGAAPAGGKTALDLPEDTFSAQLRAGLSEGPGASAPHVMRSSLAAPYVYGTLFVNALRRAGGWSSVDRAWDDPPATTEQILHIEKWLTREPPLAVKPPPYATLGAGWHAADEDSEGELGVRIAFEEWMDASVAAEASAGWGGDRGVLVARGADAAFAWTLRYDATKSKDERAARSYEALTHAFEKAFGPPQMRDGSFVCRERADRGPMAVVRSGSDIVFTFGPAQAGEDGWKSSGSCALARRWTREIVAGATVAAR